jgi:hypothetical protein
LRPDTLYPGGGSYRATPEMAARLAKYVGTSEHSVTNEHSEGVENFIHQRLKRMTALEAVLHQRGQGNSAIALRRRRPLRQGMDSRDSGSLLRVHN